MRTNTLLIPAILATGLLTHAAGAADLFNNGGGPNGGLSTGATTGSGIAAMPGTTWSELQNDGAGTANTGAGSTASTTFRRADDFTVPAGGWTIREIACFAYQSNQAAQTINGINVQIWNGPPNAGGTVIFGDTTTNRYNSARPTNVIRTFSTTVPAAALPTVVRNVWEIRALIETAPGVGLTLAPGTYWVDYQFVQNPALAAAGVFAPAVTVVGARNRPTDNALQSNAGVWAAAIDGGNPATGPDVALDFPFVIRNTVTPPGGGGGGCAGDVNGDNQVNVADLLTVISAWGACP